MENIYTRQDEIGDINLPQSVAVIGCGGTGVWATLYSAMIGIEHIGLFDSDTIEAHNLNRIPFTASDVNRSKTEVLATLINKIRPDTLVERHGNISDDLNVLIHFKVILDCTDDYKIQLIISKFCKDNDIRYIKSGYDGTHITLTNTIPGWDAEPENSAGYDTPPTPSFVLPASLLGSMMVMSMVYDKQPDISIDTKDLFEKLNT